MRARVRHRCGPKTRGLTDDITTRKGILTQRMATVTATVKATVKATVMATGMATQPTTAHPPTQNQRGLLTSRHRRHIDSRKGGTGTCPSWTRVGSESTIIVLWWEEERVRVVRPATFRAGPRWHPACHTSTYKGAVGHTWLAEPDPLVTTTPWTRSRRSENGMAGG